MKTKSLPLTRFPNARKRYWHPKDYTHWASQHHVAAYLHKNYELGLHGHRFIEVNLVAKGQGWHSFDGTVFKVRQGDIFVIPVGMQHGYVPRTRLDIYHLLLHPQFMENYGARMRAIKGFIPFFTCEPFFRKKPGERNHLYLKGIEFIHLRDLMSTLVRENDLPTAPLDISTEGLSLYLIQVLCRYYSRQYGLSDERRGAYRNKSLDAVYGFIHENYSRKLTLNEIAQAGCFQPNYLCRLFQRSMDMSPLEYVSFYRTLRAERLILETDKRIKQIAALTGFYDAAHLNKVFKRFKGYTPSELRFTSK
ncbi:MAG: hypothetical protein A2293_03295 [Elusimicrobia bacterium RIFOXYB2_FULL_49_7]|nr:MAG: hypothetical protein A2293_03295 [Elusimicrobia bacterium RIFOXYB2_FULL_49_7]